VLQAQSSRELDLGQTLQEIAEKSSKIVPPGAPFLPKISAYISCSKSGGRPTFVNFAEY
jgi:hypothetical protein